MVSIINIVMMCFDLLFAIGFTVFLFVFIKKKFHTTISAFFIGCVTWIVSVMILDAITVILSKNGNSVAIMELAVFAFAIGCAGIAFYFWKKYIISNNKNNLEKNHEDATQVVD